MPAGLIFIFCFFSQLYAKEIGPLRFEQKSDQLEIKPPDKHHFNLKAPFSVKVDGQKTNAQKGDYLASLTIPKDFNEIEVKAYVCDAANSYCISKTESFQKKPKTATKNKTASTGSKLEGYYNKKEKAWVNSPDQAFKEAKTKGLPVFIDFYGIWCPPCNQMDDLVLNTKEVSELLAKNFIKLKMDVDSPLAQEFLNSYKIRFFPTYVFATADQDEIHRLIGFQEKEQFINTARLAFDSRLHSMKVLSELAKKNDQGAALKLGKLHLLRGEWQQALEHLDKLPKNPKDQELFESKMQARVELAKNTEEKIHLLEEWIAQYPNSFKAPQIYDELRSAYDENKQEDKLASTLRRAEKTYAKLAELGDSQLTKVDLSEGSLHMLRAESLMQAKDQAAANIEFKKCIEYFQQEAKRSSVKFARGSELNRAYCLRKSGALKEAMAIYQRGIKLFPTDFTFYFGLGRLYWEDAKDKDQALKYLNLAMDRAYGPQRVRTTLFQAKLLSETGSSLEATKLIDQELGQIQDEPFNERQIKRLKNLRAQITKVGSSQ